MTDLLFPCGCFGPSFSDHNQIPHSPVQDYDSSSTRLLKAIELQNWAATTSILKKDSTEASVWPSETIIAALIQANPSGVREKDSDGQLPIHHACANGASYGVIYRLLIACPDSLDVRNSWGNFPVDIAMSDPSSTTEEIIQALKKRPSYYAVQSYKDGMNELKIELVRARTEKERLAKENEARKAEVENLARENAARRKEVEKLAKEREAQKMKEIQLVRKNSFHVQKEEQLLHILQSNMD